MGLGGSADRERANALQTSLEALQRRLDASQNEARECATSRQSLGERLGVSDRRLAGLEQELQRCVATSAEMGSGSCALERPRLWQGPRSQAMAVINREPILRESQNLTWFVQLALEQDVKRLARPVAGTAVIVLADPPAAGQKVSPESALTLRLVDVDDRGSFVLAAFVMRPQDDTLAGAGPWVPASAGFVGIDQQGNVVLQTDRTRWTATLFAKGFAFWTWPPGAADPAPPSVTVGYADPGRRSLRASTRADPFDLDLLLWSPRG